MRNPLRALAPALAFLLAIPALAQYSIAKIEIHGAGPYTDAQILSVAGLQPGQMLSQNSLGNAAQHLLDTGLFDDTQVGLGGAGLRRIVIFDLKLKPTAQLLRGSYANFVWLTPTELDAAIRAKVPLYRSLFSDAGNFPDTVQAALQQILTAKGVTATVTHTIIEPTTAHPQRLMSFRVETPSIYIGKITCSITGASVSQQSLDKYLATLTGRNYAEGLSGGIQDELINPFHNLGYITAKLGDLQRTPAPIAGQVSVDVTATIDLGPAYKVSTITWQETPIYSAADFAKNLEQKPGDVANATLLRKTEAPIIAAYLAKGYLDVYLDDAPQLDTAAHTAAYSLKAVPGEQYRIKSLDIQGLSPEARADFDRGWLLKVGDLYNEPYVKRFLADNTALRKLDAYAGSYGASADPQTHLVDLTLMFQRISH
ncbi:MAG: POTRA domain-containing protein [Acidobacteriota bacterium]